jgi:hypothetical protein
MCVEIAMSMVTLMSNANAYDVFVNGDDITIKSNNLFEDEFGKIRLLTIAEKQLFETITDPAEKAKKINETNLYYNPYYYVLDNSGYDFKLRAYALDQPSVIARDYRLNNPSSGVRVSTGVHEIRKVDSGYVLKITTVSDDRFKSASDTDILCQLSFLCEEEMAESSDGIVTVMGNYLGKTETNERMYEFIFETTLDFDVEKSFWVENFRVISGDIKRVMIDLRQTLNIIYAAKKPTLGYIYDESDDIFKRRGFTGDYVPASWETIEVNLGDYLSHLYTPSRTVHIGREYKRYEYPVYAEYDETVYKRDPVTGSIFSISEDDCMIDYTVLFEKGEIKKAEDGTPIIKHAVGELILDSAGKPIPINDIESDQYVTLLLLGYSYLASNDPEIVDYRSFYTSAMTEWITYDMVNIQKETLEQTSLYFLPKDNSGWCEVVRPDSMIATVNSRQDLKVTYFVFNRTYNDYSLREEIERQTLIILREEIAKEIVSLAAIYKRLLEKLGQDVSGIKITGLGGDSNYDIVTLRDLAKGLSLKNVSTVLPNGQLTVREAVSINFMDSQYD